MAMMAAGTGKSRRRRAGGRQGPRASPRSPPAARWALPVPLDRHSGGVAQAAVPRGARPGRGRLCGALRGSAGPGAGPR